jgi:DNA topoisomerase-1
LIAKSDIHLSNKKIQAILHDDKKSAEAVNLVHVHDNQPGINRIKKGVDFIYVSGKKKIKDKLTLNRIKKLVIPPAWENVWICNINITRFGISYVIIQNFTSFMLLVK